MQLGDVVAARFTLEALAGSGGMGVVYRARDAFDGRLVALKLLRARVGEGDADAEATRFDREARVLAGLAHPGIVGYLAHGTAATGQPFLAMEWLEGESLSARLRRGPLSLAEAVSVARQVTAALAAAHRLGVVHRDVKPANLHLVDGSLDRVKVLDFGIARLGADPALTATGTMMGTPGYMAPEQARGEKGVDARADVFSLGCVLFECVAGRAPFAGDDVMAVLLKVVLDDPPRLSHVRPGVPIALERLVHRALEKQPSARQADADELAAELAALDVDLASAPPPPRVPGGADEPATISLGPTSLGTGERRVVCLVLARGDARGRVDEATEPPTRASTSALQAALSGFGARVDVLADGALLVTLEPGGAATDQAARAARAALALSALLPGGAVALVAGRAETGRRVPVGDVVDRGVALLALPGGRVRLDPVAAALVEVGFHVERDAAGQVLLAEHDVRGQARALLGKPTPYVGRDRELATLEGLFDEAASESSPRAALVVGAAGLGKSRLRQELVRRLTQRRDAPAVWLARADALQATSAFGLVAPMIRRALGVLDGAPLEGARERVRARVAASVEAADRERVTHFLGELARVPFPDDGYLPLATARRDRRVMADEMRNAFCDWMRGEARHPLVVVLEDLHAGDAPSIAFVDAALAELQDRPLFVVALARPEVHDVFPKLWAERHVQEVRLGPLARRAGEELARAVLGDRVSAEAVAHVVDLAAGNAFYLEELLRAVAEGARELPSTVLAMVEARIEGLDGSARRALRAASVFGGAAWPGAVAALLGPCGAQADAARDRAAARATLDDLTRRELLTARRQSRFDGEEELGFRHALLRDAAYATLTEHDRAFGHRAAGAWLVAAGEQDPLVLAEHFERGGESAAAVAHYLRAAEQALAASDLVGTSAIVDRALAAGRDGIDDETRGRLLALSSEANAWGGDFARAEVVGLEALRLLRPGSGAWCAAASAIVMAIGPQNDVARLQRTLAPLDGATPDADGVHAYANLLVICAVRFLTAGFQAPAEAICARIEAERARSDHPYIVAGHAITSAYRLMLADDQYACVVGMRFAEKKLFELGHRRYATTAITLSAVALTQLGAHELAEAEFARAAHLTSSMAMHSFMPMILHNRGLTLMRLGRLDDALAVEREASAQIERVYPGLRRSAHNYLAKIHLAAGRLDEAAREAATATGPELPGVRGPLAHALATEALVAVARGHVDLALTAARRAHAILDELGVISEGGSIVRLALVEALLASGQRSEAAACALRARQKLLERAATIGEPELARSFLEAVPEHARTLALARALVG